MTNEGPPRAALLGLSPRVCQALHWVAVGWALVAIVGLSLAGPLDLLAHRPGGASFEIAERPIFMGLFAVGVLLAMRWEIIGGAIAAFTAAGLVVFASEQLKPLPATIVIIAFVVPAVLWIVIDLNDQPPRKAIFGLVVAAMSVTAGGVIAENIYDELFGSTHPESDTAELPESVLDWIWSGAVTKSSIVVTAKMDDDSQVTRLVISEDVGFTDARLSDTAVADDHGVVRFSVSELSSDTAYHYAVEVDGVLDRVRTGSFRTLPDGPGSFTVAIGADARVGANGVVFDAIRRVDPLVYLIHGDLHYTNIDTSNKGLYEDAFDLSLALPAPSALYRSTPVGYVWDDHDFGANGSDMTSAGAGVAHETFRQYVPHYQLAGPESAVYQAFTIGRVRFILTDGRAMRTPAPEPDDEDKSMFGPAQKDWLKHELLDANGVYPLIVWLNPVPWIVEQEAGADHWGGYSTERRELANFIADNDIGGLLMLAGDAHMLAIDDGTNSDYSDAQVGGFPVMHSAALDRPGSVKGGPYSHGSAAGGGQFAVLTVADEGGSSVTVTLSGRNWLEEELLTYTFVVDG